MQNDLLGVLVKHFVVQNEKTCVLTQICCVLLAFIIPDLAWCWWHITKKLFLFYLILKLFTLGNIIFNSASRC